MSFRRLPFQFSTTDPVERQRELERRFGLPSSRNMFVDVVNPLSTGTVPKDSNISSNSPRLQHRVPIFVEGYDQPIQSSVDSSGVIPENKKPNVRVIPIEVEGAEKRAIPRERQRTASGPAGIAKEQNNGHLPQSIETSPLKRSMIDLSEPSVTKSSTLPRVHNIPIKVEGASNLKSPKLEKVLKSPKSNGCTVTKSKIKSPEKDHIRKSEPNKLQKTEEEKRKSALENSMKKIETVLEEMKSYESGVQEFTGTTKDKQYRYLDEMLTRCMLKMDEIDTMGNENLRLARKNAIKKIQASIDLLENKANAASELTVTSSSQDEIKTSEEQEVNKTVNNLDEGAFQNDAEMKESHCDEKEASKTVLENSALQKSDVEMSGTQDSELDARENLVECTGAVQKTDVEMKESEGDSPGKQVTPEVPFPEEVTNVCEIKAMEKPSELSSEVPEVEMAEIKRASSSQILNSEIPEVEMTDNTSIQNTVSGVNIPVNEENMQNQDPQLEPNISQEDVEMKDVQERCTLDDEKETVAKDESEKCVPSQPEEKTESNVTITETVCTNETSQKFTM